MTPKRIHFNRHAGKSLPAGTILVTRGNHRKWGNPAVIGEIYEPWGRVITDNREACEAFREYLDSNPDFVEAAKRELRGHDLACNCREGEMNCHGQILLELVNMPPESQAKDCRGVLLTEGPEGLLAAVNGAQPVETASQAPQDEAKPEAQPFPITRASDMNGIAEAADFVEGLLTEGGASVVYGPSNTGKSFWILDLGTAVATGKDFRDELEVEPGAVIYVALEGSHGARNRIEALKRTGRLPDSAPLFLCFYPVSLLEAGHDKRLAATVKAAAEQSGLPCRLVILDTLARAMAGGDENKGADMTKAVQSMDAVREATGAHVLLVHHCGKDEAKGARGHSSLRAAVDTEIEISRPEGETISTVRVTKQRDLPMGEAMPFSLESVTLGIDRRGKPITSCVVHHQDEMMASKPAKAGRKPLCTAEEMLAYLPADTVKDWQERVNAETGLGLSQFYAHKKTLEAKGKFRRETATHRIITA